MNFFEHPQLTAGGAALLASGATLGAVYYSKPDEFINFMNNTAAVTGISLGILALIALVVFCVHKYKKYQSIKEAEIEEVDQSYAEKNSPYEKSFWERYYPSPNSDDSSSKAENDFPRGDSFSKTDFPRDDSLSKNDFPRIDQDDEEPMLVKDKVNAGSVSPQ